MKLDTLLLIAAAAFVATMAARTVSTPTPWAHLPACKSEQATQPCYWDARANGNGLGTSFYNEGGKRHYIGD